MSEKPRIHDNINVMQDKMAADGVSSIADRSITRAAIRFRSSGSRRANSGTRRSCSTTAGMDITLPQTIRP